MSTQIELFWDRDRDPSRVFKFSSQFSGTSGNALLEYPGQSVRMRIELGGENIIALMEWDEDQRIRVDFVVKVEDEEKKAQAIISTSFEGYERIFVEVVQRNDNVQVNTL